jgi:hypothetical protein
VSEPKTQSAYPGDSEPKPFDEWAILELFGHQRLAGRVTNAQVGGASFVRVDVPNPLGQIKLTKFLNPTAIYSITPCTESVATAAAMNIDASPISRFDLEQLAGTQQRRLPDGEDEQDPY